MSLVGCQINPIDVNFHLQKSFEFFDKTSADKIWSKKTQEIKVSPLMPIRVNGYFRGTSNTITATLEIKKHPLILISTTELNTE